MTISIMLADDHPVVRRGMQTLLEAEPDFSVIGETGDGLDTVREVERLQPDVLVLSLGRRAHGCSPRSRLRIWIRSGSRQQRRTPLIQNLVEFQADDPGIVVHSRVDHTAPYLFDLYPRATRHLERHQCVLTLE